MAVVEEADGTFSGEVKVASSIVDHLSSGLYESPASCLKELINNAYDADADLVQVFVKPDADRIVVSDNGHGLSKDQFTEHFDRVSDSSKRDESSITQAHQRPKIGLIGIGFIAANEICERMEIFSTQAGSTDLLHVEVDFSEMRKPRSERKDADDEVKKGDYVGELETCEPDEHYTKIFLNDIRGDARDLLIDQDVARGLAKKGQSLFGLNPDNVCKALKKPGIKSWDDFDFYTQTMLDVALNVPVPYAPNWIPDEHQADVAHLEEAVRALNFKVQYDGAELRKPVVLRKGGAGTVLRHFTLEGEHVGAEGYLYAKYRSLHPEDLNGVLIRIRNAAVGDYDNTFMAFPRTINPLFQRWISCEIYADDRLEDAMNIDRRTLRAAHPAFAELQRLFHQEFESFLKQVRKELHTEPTKGRQANRASDEVDKIRDALSKPDGVSKGTAKKVLKDLEGSSSDGDVKRLIHKYTIAEFYELVVAAAAVLPQPHRDRFIESLTDRVREGR